LQRLKNKHVHGASILGLLALMQTLVINIYIKFFSFLDSLIHKLLKIFFFHEIGLTRRVYMVNIDLFEPFGPNWILKFLQRSLWTKQIHFTGSYNSTLETFFSVEQEKLRPAIWYGCTWIRVQWSWPNFGKLLCVNTFLNFSR
jgi:hypothetical protein